MFPLWRVGRRPPVGEFGRSSREPVTALVAARLQNGTARTGAHAMAKAMLLGTTTITWLESAFHARLLGETTKPGGQPLGLQRLALYRGNSVFSACGKPATFAVPTSFGWGCPQPCGQCCGRLPKRLWHRAITAKSFYSVLSAERH